MKYEQAQNKEDNRKAWRISPLRLFVILSLGLHLALATAWYVPAYLEELAQRRAEQAARLEAKQRQEAELRRKKLEEKRKAAQKETTKKQIAQLLHNDFAQIVDGDIDEEYADELWQDVLNDLDGDLSDYADLFLDDSADLSELRNRMGSLKQSLVESLRERLHNRTVNRISEDFLAYLREKVVPEMAKAYEKRIDERIGRKLSSEGGRLIRDETSYVERERREMIRSLDRAASDVNAADSRLKYSAERLDARRKSAGEQTADIVKRDDEALSAAKGKLRQAFDELSAADDKIADTGERRAALPEDMRGRIDNARGEVAESLATARGTVNTGNLRKAAERAGETARKTKPLRESLQAAKNAANSTKLEQSDRKNLAAAYNSAARHAQRAETDVAEAARRLADAASLHDRTMQRIDGDINGELKRDRSYNNETQRRFDMAAKNLEAARKRAEIFSDALHEQFRDVLDKRAVPVAKMVEGIRRAEKLDVMRGKVDGTRAAAAELKTAIADARNAAQEAEFDPKALARAVMREVVDDKVKEILAVDFAEGFREDSLPRLSAKLAEVYAARLKKSGFDDEDAVRKVKAEIETMLGELVPESTDAGESGTRRLVGDQRLDKADPNAKRNRKREKAVAETFSAKAGEIAEAGMAQVTGSDSDDSRFVRMAEKQGQEGKADTGYLTLWERVDTLSNNVGEGRMGFLEGMDSAALGGIRRTARALRGRGRFRSYYRFDKKKYEELTKDMHERSDATGESWTLETAAGETMSAAGGLDLADYVTPSSDPKDSPEKIEEKEPYKPGFKTIRFARIPYRDFELKIDGELNEWEKVPGLPMRPYNDPGSYHAKNGQSIKVVWDNAGFYFAYDYKDVDKSIHKVVPEIFWEGDGAEIWFDSLNTKSRKRGENWVQQFWAWPFGGKGHPEYVGGEAFVKNNESGKFAPYTADKFQREAKKTDYGWTMEVFIPKALIHNLRAEPGRILGFNLSICSGSNAYYYWAGTSDVRTSVRPDTWGDILLAGSDGKIEVVGKLESEKKTGAEKEPVPNGVVLAGRPLKLRVTDPDMNISPNKPDTISVTVKSGSGDTELVFLEETEVGSGVFEGAIRTEFSIGEQVENVLSLYDGDEVTITYIDQARSDGTRNVEVSLTVPVAANVFVAAGK